MIKIKKLLAAIFDDASSWPLVFSNLLTIYWAINGHWPLAEIMWIYWCQSVIIGFFNFIRILTLKNFSTVGLLINDRPVAPTRATKIQTAFFFLIHYGGFHLTYAIFLATESAKVGINLFYILGGGLIFFSNHLFSFFYNRQRDEKKVNLGRVMGFPYLRIIPMHLTIIFGSLLSGSLPLVLFMGLKTLADVGMHAIEHQDKDRVKI